MIKDKNLSPEDVIFRAEKKYEEHMKNIEPIVEKISQRAIKDVENSLAKGEKFPISFFSAFYKYNEEDNCFLKQLVYKDLESKGWVVVDKKYVCKLTTPSVVRQERIRTFKEISLCLLFSFLVGSAPLTVPMLASYFS